MNQPKFQLNQNNENFIKSISQKNLKSFVLPNSPINSIDNCYIVIKYLNTQSKVNRKLISKLQQILKESSKIISNIIKQNKTLGSSAQADSLSADLIILKQNLATITNAFLKYQTISKSFEELADLNKQKLPQFNQKISKSQMIPLKLKNMLKQMALKNIEKQQVKINFLQEDLTKQICKIIQNSIKNGPNQSMSEISQLKNKDLRGKMVEWQRILQYQHISMNNKIHNNVNSFLSTISKNRSSVNDIDKVFNSLTPYQKQYFEPVYTQIKRLKQVQQKKQTIKYPSNTKIPKNEDQIQMKIKLESIDTVVQQLSDIKDQKQRIIDLLQKIANYPTVLQSQLKFRVTKDNCPKAYLDSLIKISNRLNDQSQSQQINNQKETSSYYQKLLQQNNTIIEQLREQIKTITDQKNQHQKLVEYFQKYTQDLEKQKQDLQKQKQKLQQTNNALSQRSVIFTDEKFNQNQSTQQKYQDLIKELTDQNENLKTIISQHQKKHQKQALGSHNSPTQKQLKLQNQQFIQQIQQLKNTNKQLKQSLLQESKKHKELNQEKDLSKAAQTQQITKLNRIINDTSYQLNQKDRQIRQLSNRNDSLQNQNRQLKSTMDLLRSNDKQQITCQISIIKQNQKRMIAQLRKLESSNHQLNSIIAKSKKQQQDRIKALQLKISQTQSRYQKSIEQSQKNYQKVNQNLQSYIKQNQQLQQTLKKVKKGYK